MKNSIIAAVMLASLTIHAQEFPVANGYAPTYQDVVVLKDNLEQTYSTSFTHLVDQVDLTMPMDPSCKKIRIVEHKKLSTVICVSSENKETVVGTLGEVIITEMYQAYQVNWNSTVKLVQFQNTKDKSVSYSIVVIN